MTVPNDWIDPPTVTLTRGPDGVPISVKDLPPSDQKRWTVSRKAIVVCAIEGGVITLSDAMAKYNLSYEEFQIWREAYQKYGSKGMRVSKIQLYKRHEAFRMSDNSEG